MATIQFKYRMYGIGAGKAIGSGDGRECGGERIEIGSSQVCGVSDGCGHGLATGRGTFDCTSLLFPYSGCDGQGSGTGVGAGTIHCTL